MQRGGTRMCVSRRFSGRVDMHRRAMSCKREQEEGRRGVERARGKG